MNAPASLAAIEPHSPYAMPFPEKATAAATARARAVVSARYEVALQKPRNWDQVRQEVVRECRRPSFANDKGALYRKPIGNGVEGLGIRFVEMALRCMKNVEISTELTYEDEYKEIHRCSVTDLEANVPYGTEIPVAWFAHGLRIVDIANPHAPREVASFLPPVPEGANRVSSNDVTVDARGLLYLLDRTRGMHILERP